jgi:hypothetical protein
MSFTWFSRNIFQLCEGDPRYPTKYLLTVDSLISIPSFISSRCILGAPERVLSTHPADELSYLLRHGRSSALAVATLPCPERNPFRCQPMTVSALTITNQRRHSGHLRERANALQSNLSLSNKSEFTGRTRSNRAIARSLSYPAPLWCDRDWLGSGRAALARNRSDGNAIARRYDVHHFERRRALQDGVRV